MKTIIHFILLTAIRDRLFTAIIALLLLIVGITMALSETVMVEKPETHLAMSAGLARIVVNMGIALFVCFQVKGLYESKEIEVMLTRPISRVRLLIGLWLGFACVAALLTVILSAILFAFNLGGNIALLIWSGSLLLEGLVVVAIALFSSISNKGFVTSVLTCFSFYVLGRLMAFFVATANARITMDLWVHRAMRYTIDAISVVMPRLDMFADTDWLVYGMINWQNVAFFTAQAAIFIPFMLAIALFDFKRKQF
jgi:ABC-type transport system involved in multi-copper enzyme maturation permease subunit